MARKALQALQEVLASLALLLHPELREHKGALGLQAFLASQELLDLEGLLAFQA